MSDIRADDGWVCMGKVAAAPTVCSRMSALPNFRFRRPWTELVPELEQQASDYTVTKQRVTAFIGTSLTKSGSGVA